MDKDIKVASDEEFQEALDQYHRDSRHQHFANCWRLGTEEKDNIWKYYTQDDEMKAGCAIETTVGQLVAALPSRPAIQDEDDEFNPDNITQTSEWNLSFTTDTCDIRFGTCKYQQDENPTQDRPAGWNAAITFLRAKTSMTKSSSASWLTHLRTMSSLNQRQTEPRSRFDLTSRRIHF